MHVLRPGTLPQKAEFPDRHLTVRLKPVPIPRLSGNRRTANVPLLQNYIKSGDPVFADSSEILKFHLLFPKSAF